MFLSIVAIISNVVVNQNSLRVEPEAWLAVNALVPSGRGVQSASFCSTTANFEKFFLQFIILQIFLLCKELFSEVAKFFKNGRSIFI